MQQSVSGNPQKTGDLVRICPDVVFHRDVFLPTVLSAGGGSVASCTSRYAAGIATGFRREMTPC